MSTITASPNGTAEGWTLESDHIQVALLPMAELFIDDRFQRAVDQKRVEHIATNFDPKMIGVPVVNRRTGTEFGTGRYSVCDGQHRVEALRMRDAEQVLCQVVAVPERDEALLFVDLQHRRKDVKGYERHRALVFARHDEALAVERMVKAEGFHIIGGAQNKGGIAGVARLYMIMFGTMGTAFPTGVAGKTSPRPESLRFALRTIREAWGVDAPAISRRSTFIDAFALFHVVFGAQIDESHLLDKLAEKRPSAVYNLGMGRKHFGERGEHSSLIGREIADIYNQGLRGKKRIDPRRIGRPGAIVA